MPANMTLEVEGLQALQRKLARVGDFRPVIELIEETTTFVEEEAERGARPHAADIGKLSHGNNIRQHVEPFLPGGPVGEVFTNSPIVVAVDQGRKPGGKMAPIALMEVWAARHGIALHESRHRSKPSGFYLARAVARKGTKGVKFFAKAEEAGSRRIRELAPGAARGIEQEFRR